MNTLLLAAQAICAISLPLQKLLLGYSTPLFLAGFRMLLAGAISIGYAKLSQPNLVVTTEQWRCYLSGVLSGGYLKYVLKMYAVSLIPVSRVALLCTVSPFVTAGFSYAHINERLSVLQIIGMVISCAGLFVVLCNPADITWSWHMWLPCSIADMAMIGAVIAHCHGSMVTRRAIKVFEHTPSVVTGIRMLGGGLLVMLTALCVEGLNPVTQWFPFLVGVFGLVLISNIVGHWLYTISYRYHSPTLLSLSDGLSPFFVAAYGWLLLNEPVTTSFCIATLVMLGGLTVFSYHEKIWPLLKNALITMLKRVSY